MKSTNYFEPSYVESPNELQEHLHLASNDDINRIYGSTKKSPDYVIQGLYGIYGETPEVPLSAIDTWRRMQSGAGHPAQPYLTYPRAYVLDSVAGSHRELISDPSQPRIFALDALVRYAHHFRVRQLPDVVSHFFTHEEHHINDDHETIDIIAHGIYKYLHTDNETLNIARREERELTAGLEATRPVTRPYGSI